MKARLSTAALPFVKLLQLRHEFHVSKPVVRFTARDKYLIDCHVESSTDCPDIRYRDLADVEYLKAAMNFEKEPRFKHLKTHRD
jgi:hypothetical protein